jgi:uncharacterized protein YjbJ (UPF0337 family)
MTDTIAGQETGQHNVFVMWPTANVASSDTSHDAMFSESANREQMTQAATLLRRNRHMSDKNSGPEEAVKGVVEGVKGKAKVVAGTVAGRDDLYREGQAQQDKADAQRDAAKKEAEADSARAAAKAAEERQKSEQ